MDAQRAWIPYCGAAPEPAELLARWNFDPWLLAALGAAAVVYLRAVPAAGARHRARFGTALALGVILFVSPFCALTSALFSARVVHHVLLAVGLAPLLAWSLPFGRVRPPGSLAAWTAIQAVTFWAWHAPPLYAAALSVDFVFWLMQLSILGTALGFWLSLRSRAAPEAAAALLATMVQMGLLGALITFAAAPIYAPHWLTTGAWGLSPLADQQLAGLIMWAPAAGLYLAAALLLFGRWLKRESGATAA